MEMNVNGLDQLKIGELADLVGVSTRTIRYTMRKLVSSIP